jgi:DNA repair protein RecN (Recombination protein N)
MLVSASIRNIVLIEALDLELKSGLCVLTGETGAGKSIVLDALGLVTGARSEKALVRAGATQGSVTAVFEPPARHPVRALLKDNEIDPGDEVILRRTISSDGRTRAFINDQPVSVGLLRSAGESLFEVHGQHDERGMLVASAHRGLLDAFGALDPLVTRCGEAHARLDTAETALREAETAAKTAAAESDYLRHAAEELSKLAAEPGEEERLSAERGLLMNAEKMAGELSSVSEVLGAGSGLEAKLAQALKRLEKMAPQAMGRLDAAVSAVSRALIETGEARAQSETALRDLAFDADRLAVIEDRVFALKDAARKYRVTPDQLPQLAADFAAKVGAIESSGATLSKLRASAAEAREKYQAAAEALSVARKKAALALETAVARELKPLKLDKSKFRVTIAKLDGAPSPSGHDRVEFEVSTNPGAPFGPLQKIASGGELARFVLALKVALAAGKAAPTLVFDEVDQGVGGAVADAVGERLAKLSKSAQIIVVTHSPQIAARADHHWRISKAIGRGKALTEVTELDSKTRREEIARMLSGAEITKEARAAAERLIASGGGR